MKKQKRAELKRLREALENKELLSEKITETFLSSELYKNADTLLLYYSVGSEASTNDIFTSALNDGKRVAFPLCTDTDGLMRFYYIIDESQLVSGMYGIKEPIKGCEEYHFSHSGVCIVPGLSFDREGYRIGYGKGYYDRFLSQFTGTSIGLCFEALLSESLPKDAYDKKVNYLITDKKIYNFNQEDM